MICTNSKTRNICWTRRGKCPAAHWKDGVFESRTSISCPNKIFLIKIERKVEEIVQNSSFEFWTFRNWKFKIFYHDPMLRWNWIWSFTIDKFNVLWERFSQITLKVLGLKKRCKTIHYGYYVIWWAAKFKRMNRILSEKLDVTRKWNSTSI